jgi:V/A-type H+-transporting ATPase subunit D
MSFQKVKPTVPELDLLKKKKKFSQKGERLLEIKREQLFNSLKKTMNDFFQMRAEFREKMLKNYELLEKTFEIIGKGKVANIANLNKTYYKPESNITFYNQLGIDIPKISIDINETQLPTYSFADTPMHLDILMRKLRETLQIMTKLAELDSILYHFASSYQTIQRRINALDDIILPRLEKNIHTIEEILEDNEREEFIRMKKIKEFLEQKSDLEIK